MSDAKGVGLRVLELPWREDLVPLFEAVRDLPYPVWLDSGGVSGARYDIITAAPVEMRRFASGEAGQVDASLREMLGGHVAGAEGLPFSGGVVGYLAYELGREWMGLAPCGSLRLPVAAFGLYDWAVVADRLLRRIRLVSHMRHVQTAALWDELCTRLLAAPAAPDPTAGIPGEALGSSLDWSAYRRAFARVQHYLREGDVYQVNLTRRLQARSPETAWSLYRRLREFSPAPYGAFLDYGGFQLLSNAPEQFLSLREGRVTTRPIKGTRPRSHSPARDAQNRADLLASDKDRAENLMIVDLLRNDLGRVCEPGSIAVPQLFAVESYATVHHLVSTVTGRLGRGADAVDLLRACFPGGSITGAPKRRAMEIIDELEPVSREVYCGSVFYLGYDGSMDSNIAIRTIIRQDEGLYYWAGGGVVADSDAGAEYQETLDKAAAFLRLLGHSESFTCS
jgi:para-aminobenzoate synthetase component 1